MVTPARNLAATPHTTCVTWPMEWWNCTPTAWGRALLESLTVTQLVNKFSALYRAIRFITVFTTGHHWSLSWARWTQSTPSYPVSLRRILILSSHLRLDLSFKFSSHKVECYTAHRHNNVWLFLLLSPQRSVVRKPRSTTEIRQRGTTAKRFASVNFLVEFTRLLAKLIAAPYWLSYADPQTDRGKFNCTVRQSAQWPYDRSLSLFPQSCFWALQSTTPWRRMGDWRYGFTCS
jgi:hypothetical protein